VGMRWWCVTASKRDKVRVCFSVCVVWEREECRPKDKDAGE
jgi:hypothetical protein